MARLWNEQLRTSDRMRAAGFRWRNGYWENRGKVQDAGLYIGIATRIAGTVNSGPFCGYGPGRLMFTGMDVDEWHRDGTVRITWKAKPV